MIVCHGGMTAAHSMVYELKMTSNLQDWWTNVDSCLPCKLEVIVNFLTEFMNHWMTWIRCAYMLVFAQRVVINSFILLTHIDILYVDGWRQMLICYCIRDSFSTNADFLLQSWKFSHSKVLLYIRIRYYRWITIYNLICIYHCQMKENGGHPNMVQQYFNIMAISLCNISIVDIFI